MTGAMYTCRMTLLTLETLILWISFVNTTMRYACFHKQSTLLRMYPRKGNPNLLIIQVCLRHLCLLSPREKWWYFCGFEPAIYCLEWDMCPSYLDLNWQTGQDDVPPHFPTMAVFIMSPALSQPKTWNVPNSIYKNSLLHSRISRPSNLFPSFASSCELDLILLTSIPKKCVPDLLPPSGVNIGVGVYMETCWGQRKSIRGVFIGIRIY